MLFVCRPKILHTHCFQFLLGPFYLPRETKKQCLCKILGCQTKSIMVFYCILLEWFRTTSCKYKTMTSLPAKYGANFRGLRRIWEFLPTLRGVIILPPSQPRFLARFPRWEKFECEARAFFLALCPKKIKTIHLTWYNSLGIWRWLLHGLPKRQSLSTTVLFRGSEWGDSFDGWRLTVIKYKFSPRV